MGMLSAPVMKTKSWGRRPSEFELSSLSRYSSYHKIVASSPSLAKLAALLPGTERLTFNR